MNTCTYKEIKKNWSSLPKFPVSKQNNPPALKILHSEFLIDDLMEMMDVALKEGVYMEKGSSLLVKIQYFRDVIDNLLSECENMLMEMKGDDCLKSRRAVLKDILDKFDDLFENILYKDE